MEVDYHLRLVDLLQVWNWRHSSVHQRVLGTLITHIVYYDDGLLKFIGENMIYCKCHLSCTSGYSSLIPKCNHYFYWFIISRLGFLFHSVVWFVMASCKGLTWKGILLCMCGFLIFGWLVVWILSIWERRPWKLLWMLPLDVGYNAWAWSSPKEVFWT